MHKTMTRQELEQLLDELNREVPRLRHEYPDPDDFWAAFDGLAEVGLDRAEPEDLTWFQEELRLVIHLHALDPPRR
jgi:hypothetical protein